MKLVNIDLGYQLVFQDGKVLEWIIESPALFQRYAYDLLQQSKAEEGKFVLSDKDKEMSISKSMEIVLNPFDIDMNDKRILRKIYGDLSELAYDSESFILTQELLQKLQGYFYELEQKSGYPLEIDNEIDISAIFKAINVKVETESENLLEKLCEYIKIIAEVLRKKIFVFINLRSYLTDEQMEQLIEMANYNEINVLPIENCQRDFLNNCTYVIVDKDECHIY